MDNQEQIIRNWEELAEGYLDRAKAAEAEVDRLRAGLDYVLGVGVRAAMDREANPDKGTLGAMVARYCEGVLAGRDPREVTKDMCRNPATLNEVGRQVDELK